MSKTCAHYARTISQVHKDKKLNMAAGSPCSADHGYIRNMVRQFRTTFDVAVIGQHIYNFNAELRIA